MKDTDYNRLIQLVNVGGGFTPANEKAEEMLQATVKGEVVELQEVTKRDLRLHRAYMALLAEVWGYMPSQFRERVLKEDFYIWLKHLKGNYKINYTFKDGTSLVKYESISFGNMSNIRFKEYVKEQLPFIYSDVLGAFYSGEMLDNIIDTIEENFERFLNKLT
jgi:hypothetical protein